MKTTADHIAKAEASAAALINAGEATKSKVKEACEHLARAYDKVTHEIHDILLADRSIEDWDALYWNIPALHNWKPRHDEMFKGFPVQAAQAAALANLRTEVKALPIIAREAKGPTAEAQIKARVLKSFTEWAANRRAQFDWAKAICDAAEEVRPGVLRLPVSINHVYCCNAHGTQWVRIDWFMNGTRTPFQVIAAAADAAMRERAGA